MAAGSNRKVLGNPAMIAAASNPELLKAAERSVPVIINQQQRVMRVGTVILGGAAALGLLYFGSRWLHNQHKRNLLRQAATNPNIKAAIDIFDAIPGRMKQDTGTIFTPGQLLTDWINNLMFWKQSDSDRILIIAERISDFDQTTRAFRTLYDQDLMPLLQTAMSKSDYDRFIAAANMDKEYFPVRYYAADSRKIAQTKIRTPLLSLYDGKIIRLGYVDANRLINGFTTGKIFTDKYGDISPAGTEWLELSIEYVRRKYGSNAAVQREDVSLVAATAYPNHTP